MNEWGLPLGKEYLIYIQMLPVIDKVIEIRPMIFALHSGKNLGKVPYLAMP